MSTSVLTEWVWLQELYLSKHVHWVPPRSGPVTLLAGSHASADTEPFMGEAVSSYMQSAVVVMTGPLVTDRLWLQHGIAVYALPAGSWGWDMVAALGGLLGCCKYASYCLCFRALSERLRVVTDIGLGAAIGRRTYHRTGSVLEMHPHFQLWGSLAALVKDGANLARVGGRKTRAGDGGGGAGAGYTAVPSVPQAKSSGGGSEVVGSPRKQKKEKKDGRDERPGSGEGAQVEATARASVDGDAAGASETAAGDGGRWVHVDSS